jgi:sporulation-control protein
VTFVTDEAGMEVILEFDKRGGVWGGAGRDTYARHRVEHGAAESTDWISVVEGWVHGAIPGA